MHATASARESFLELIDGGCPYIETEDEARLCLGLLHAGDQLPARYAALFRSQFLPVCTVGEAAEIVLGRWLFALGIRTGDRSPETLAGLVDCHFSA